MSIASSPFCDKCGELSKNFNFVVEDCTLYMMCDDCYKSSNAPKDNAIWEMDYISDIGQCESGYYSRTDVVHSKDGVLLICRFTAIASGIKVCKTCLDLMFTVRRT